MPAITPEREEIAQRQLEAAEQRHHGRLHLRERMDEDVEQGERAIADGHAQKLGQHHPQAAPAREAQDVLSSHSPIRVWCRPTAICRRSRRSHRAGSKVTPAKPTLTRSPRPCGYRPADRPPSTGRGVARRDRPVGLLHIGCC